MVYLGGHLFSSIFSLSKVIVEPSINRGFLLQTRNYALRKGTREKKLKQKIRNIAAKKSREAKRLPRKVKKGVLPDILKYATLENRISPDNVWIQKYYAWKTYSFEEALQCHREVFHPNVFDIPDAKVTAAIELNMKGPSKSKILTTFNSLVSIPHKFKMEGQKSILVIANTPEKQEEARNAGAHLVIGPDIVRLIKIGEMSVSDYDHIITHPQMLSQLLSLKGIFKTKFPSLKQGTLGDDLAALVYKHLYGVRYTCKPYDSYPEYGFCQIPIGTIDMDTEQLKENFKTILEDILKRKPKIREPMILRIRMSCPPNYEAFKLDLSEFIEEEKYDDDEDDDDDDYDKVSRAEV